MAPKVTVPCDFGREYIGSPDHSNLKLKLKDNNELLVNSMIVSYNSPVIHDLTTNLHQTSLDVDDFEDAAVRCFVDCLYTGEIELVNKHILRDVYKMANVFNVTWLVSRCNGYFQNLTDIVDCEDYEEVLFLFEEARYAADTLKQSDWIDCIMVKIDETEVSKKLFIEKYLEDFNNLTIAKLDTAMALSSENSYVVGVLANYLANAENQGLSENFKHLLINCNLGVCRKTERELFEDLFDLLDTLKDLSTDDVQMIYKLYRTSSKKTRQNSVDQVKVGEVTEITPEKGPQKVVKVVAMHDYWSDTLGVINFKKGDEMTILDSTDDTWWKVELLGRQGVAPAEFLKQLQQPRRVRGRNNYGDRDDYNWNGDGKGNSYKFKNCNYVPTPTPRRRNYYSKLG